MLKMETAGLFWYVGVYLITQRHFLKTLILILNAENMKPHQLISQLMKLQINPQWIAGDLS
jgi:hypothetical protein